jgi:RNA polymerase sigma-70 factor, ECF subfamily
MDEEQGGDRADRDLAGQQDVGRAYREHRPYLVDLAQRMLGDAGAAEDVVQEAFSRLLRIGTGEIEDERGWLIVVTARLCLDQIRSARSRRERPHDASEIEFITPRGPASGSADLADPADRVTFDDRVRLALLIVLQRLTPAERVVFILHDIFQMPFPDVAQTVGRSAAACRQLGRRARQKMSAAQDAANHEVAGAEHRVITERFVAACASGDLDGLLRVLAPDAWGAVDLGPASAPQPVITGARRVAIGMLTYWGPERTLVPVPSPGQPALLGFIGQELAAVILLTVREDLIQAIQVIADPDQVAFASQSGGLPSPY